MASLEQLIGDYMDAAVGPEDLQKLALLQVANSSVQDDAVNKAAANLQGVEKANRSALEQYMIAQEEAAKAESDKAVEYASKRLSEITQAITMFGTVSGLSKSQKAELEALKRERDKILKAFPQLGFASDGSTIEVASAPKSSKFSNDMAEEDFIEALKDASNEELSDYISGNFGRIPDSFKDMIAFKYSQSPELSAKVKTDPKLRGLYSIIGSGSLGDAQKAAKDSAAAKAKAKADEEEKKLLDGYLVDAGLAVKANNGFAKAKYQTQEFKDKMKKLKAKNMLKAEDIAALKRVIGEF